MLYHVPFLHFCRVLHDLASVFQGAIRKGTWGTGAEASRTIVLVSNNFCGSVDSSLNPEGCHPKCRGHSSFLVQGCDSISLLHANKQRGNGKAKTGLGCCHFHINLNHKWKEREHENV